METLRQIEKLSVHKLFRDRAKQQTVVLRKIKIKHSCGHGEWHIVKASSNDGIKYINHNGDYEDMLNEKISYIETLPCIRCQIKKASETNQ